MYFTEYVLMRTEISSSYPSTSHQNTTDDPSYIRDPDHLCCPTCAVISSCHLAAGLFSLHLQFPERSVPQLFANYYLLSDVDMTTRASWVELHAFA